MARGAEIRESLVISIKAKEVQLTGMGPEGRNQNTVQVRFEA